MVENGYFLTWRDDVSLNPVALVRECAESNDSKLRTNVFASKDIHICWKTLSFVLRKPTLVECVK